MTVLLVRRPVDCSWFLRAGFSVALLRAFATTVVTRPSLPVERGLTLLKRSPDSSGADNSEVISLCVTSAGRFPRSSAGFELVLFESENVMLARGVVLIGLGYFANFSLQFDLLRKFLVHPNPSSQDESESSLSLGS